MIRLPPYLTPLIKLTFNGTTARPVLGLEASVPSLDFRTTFEFALKSTLLRTIVRASREMLAALILVMLPDGSAPVIFMTLAAVIFTEVVVGLGTEVAEIDLPQVFVSVMSARESIETRPTA